MPLTRVWSKGQITIPSSYRKQLNIEENSALNMILIGETIVLTPYKTETEKFAKKMESQMKKKKISLEDVLRNLRKTRKDHVKKKYGSI